jgi:hypothetical protein
MEFTVVDIPVNGASMTPSSPIIDALLKNIGKAISIPCGDRDMNNVRKSLRQSLMSRKLLKTYTYKTRTTEADGKGFLIAWLEEKKPAATALESKDGINPNHSIIEVAADRDDR